MADKQLVMIVNGYGCHNFFPDPEQNKFLEGYRRYLDRVVRFINERLPDLIIFSGGSTQKKSAPGVTEAWAMWCYVSSRIGEIRMDDVYKRVVLEERAFTTHGNSYYPAKIIEKSIRSGLLRNELCQIVHFCEAQRAANVNMCDRYFLARFVERIDDIRTETESWELADPFETLVFNWKGWLPKPGSLIFNKLAMKYPWLGLAEYEERRRIARSCHI